MKPVSTSYSVLSLLLQFISVLVALVLLTALIDSLSFSHQSFTFFDSEFLRTVRQYCGPVSAVGVCVELVAAMHAGQSR